MVLKYIRFSPSAWALAGALLITQAACTPPSEDGSIEPISLANAEAEPAAPAPTLALAPTPAPTLALAPTPAPTPAPTLALAPAEPTPAALPDDLPLKLREIKSLEVAPQAVAQAVTQPLTPEQTAALLARLPPLQQKPSDSQPFAVREKSLPPPRPGDTVAMAFPPPTLAEAPTTAVLPLQVLRYSPDGEVGLAPRISVTFSQPMVAVTSLEALDKVPVPVEISPKPPGQWRWLGAQTAVWQPKERLPMATTYKVAIAAGTRAATGGVLEKPVVFTFSTPAPKVIEFSPTGDGQPLTPMLFARFDQDIDASQVLSHLSLRANKKPVPFHGLDAAAIAKTDYRYLVERLTSEGAAKRWIAVQSDAPLPKNSHMDVVFGAGLPSAEGPVVTTKAQPFAFSTYAPLKLDNASCRRAADQCPALSQFDLTFNNSLDAQAFKPSWVTVTPAIPRMKVTANWNSIHIDGLTAGRQTYSITVSEQLRDSFGQLLGSPLTVQVQTVGAVPALQAERGALTLADPSDPDHITVWSVNQPAVELKVWAVQPQDWWLYLQWRNHDQANLPPPGKLVLEQQAALSATQDAVVGTRLSIAAALKKGKGHAIVLIRSLQHRENQEPEEFITWVQATDIGITLQHDQTDMAVIATDLMTVRPVAAAAVAIRDQTWAALRSATTLADGSARLPLLDASKGEPVLTVQVGDQLAFAPSTEYANYNSSGSYWHVGTPSSSLLWHVVDDRKLYRPGEKAFINGWLRTLSRGQSGDIATYAGPRQLNWTAQDSRGHEFAKGTTAVSASGSFDTMVLLPGNADLGYAEVTFRDPTNEVRYDHTLRAEEFRRPEFESSIEVAAGPHIAGGHAALETKAAYLAGGALGGADVHWRADAQQASYAPPGWPGYEFGTWRPWWQWRGEGDGPGMSVQLQGKLDASGRHSAQLEFGKTGSARPWSIALAATVQDVNRQTWTAQSALLVHPAELYVGLQTQGTVAEAGKAFPIQVIVTDLDGKAMPGTAVTVTTTNREFDGVGRPADPPPCAIASQSNAVTCPWTPAAPGRHTLTARIVDKQGRPNQAQLTVWVAGKGGGNTVGNDTQPIEIIADKPEYRPGDVAKLLVRCAWPHAEGMLTVGREGRVQTQRLTLVGSGATVQVPIAEHWAPGVAVEVVLNGFGPRLDKDGKPDAKAPPQPLHATQRLTLAIPLKHRTLQVKMTPAQPVVAPGAKTSIEVDVRDAAGKPLANAQVLLVLVDESVLALTGYRVPSPLTTFYPQRGSGLTLQDLRTHLVLQWPDLDPRRSDLRAESLNNLYNRRQFGAGGKMMLSMPAESAAEDAVPSKSKSEASKESAPSSKPDSKPNASKGIALRQNFDPLAAFAPSVQTDANGHATVAIAMPDNLTRYRAMAVATHGDKLFGNTEATLTARLPLMVRPSPPRFANFGDKFELPVVLQNQTDKPLGVQLAARATVLTLTGATQGVQLTIAAHDRVEVRFATEANQAGMGRVQIAVSAPGFADAAQIALPVWTPATSEAFATYGVLDGDTAGKGARAQPIARPDGVFKQFGGLQVTTTSTALQGLTDAVIYLNSYPFECSEQLASRVLAIVSLKDVLAAFKSPDLPPEKELMQQVVADIAKLEKRQNYNGGFGFWTEREEPWPITTLHVALALAKAKAKGATVPPRMFDNALSYLRQIDSHLPKHYGEPVRRALKAEALYVRLQMGDRDTKAAKTLMKEAGGAKALPLEAAGWLWPVVFGAPDMATESEDLRVFIANHVEEQAGSAHFTAHYDDGAHLLLASDRRADAVVLDALMTAEPQSDIIPKIVTGLLAHRSKGRWGSTQENAWVLLALDRYFRTYEGTTPDFVARLWLGNQYAGEQQFHGRSTDRQELQVPMALLADGPREQNLVLAKEGPGRLYYRIAMNYAPKNLALPGLDRGYVVGRTYAALDKPGDVVHAADGTWQIRAGARVQVTISMLNSAVRYHTALVDPLPAGLEILNGDLLGAEPPPPNDPSGQRHWWGRWYEHSNLRDERAEAFSTYLWPGDWSFSYTTRATTPGEFVVPPAKAEQMYEPEVFGRSAVDRVVVR